MREKVQHGGKAKTSDREGTEGLARRLADLIAFTFLKQCGLEMGPQTEPQGRGPRAPAEAPLPKGFSVFPNSATSEGPYVQMGGPCHCQAMSILHHTTFSDVPSRLLALHSHL